MTRTIRTLAAFAAAATLAACSESGPTAIVSEPAFASGSSGGGSKKSITEIALTRPANAAYRSAKGKAKFAIKAGERELQVEVENIPAGTVLSIMVGSSSYSATANALGKARLNVNSTRGQSVPMSVAGAAVTVTSAAGAVVSGSF